MRDLTKHDWIMTASGRAFWPLDPRPEDVSIEDIAHALANICRFTGATREFYSVAQHSMLVASMVPPEDALWGLLHDASEAYLCDIARPLKVQPAFAPYREAEARLMAVICERFGLSPTEPESVRIADRQMLRTEQRDLMPPAQPGEERPEPPYPFRVLPMEPRVAKKWFFETFWKLTAERKPFADVVAS